MSRRIASSPIVYFGLSGDIGPAALTQLAETTVIPRFERVDGVAAAELRGRFQREIEINLDRDKLAALDMPVSEVVVDVHRGKPRAAGALAAGKRWRARAIASSVHPKRLFGELLPEGAVPDEAAVRMRGWASESATFPTSRDASES